jgi:hypothetical protein
MYLAQERKIYATVDQSILGAQLQLVNLYQNNLSTVGIQSSVIAGLAFGAINNIYVRYLNCYFTLDTTL